MKQEVKRVLKTSKRRKRPDLRTEKEKFIDHSFSISSIKPQLRMRSNAKMSLGIDSLSANKRSDVLSSILGD